MTIQIVIFKGVILNGFPPLVQRGHLAGAD